LIKNPSLKSSFSEIELAEGLVTRSRVTNPEVNNMKRLFALLALFALYSVSSATIHNVVLSGISFTPRNLTIQQGDTVRWTNQGGFHNVAEVSTPPRFPQR
jgi:plastocyanin